MNVEELRQILADMPGDWPVILQKDAEGNGYSPLEDAEEGQYSPDNTWSGEGYHSAAKLAELIADPNSGWTEEDLPPEDAIPCIILAPVN